MIGRISKAIQCGLLVVVTSFCSKAGNDESRSELIERRTDSSYFKSHGFITVSEFKGDSLHGESIRYDRSGRKMDSNFYVNNRRLGTALCWDSLGNILCREEYKDGKNVGRMESNFGPGRPALLKDFNDSGNAHGIERTWWKSGNLEKDFWNERGSTIRGAEFYPNGKLRYRHERPYQTPGSVGAFKRKLISGQTWAPNGKSTGKVKQGNGKLIRFSAEPDTVTGRYRAWHETYKDSVLESGGKVDSIEIAKWLR